MNFITFSFTDKFLTDILKQIKNEEIILKKTTKSDEIPIDVIASFIFNNIPLPKVIACEERDLFSNYNQNRMVIITGEKFLLPLYKFYFGDIELEIEKLTWFSKYCVNLPTQVKFSDITKEMNRDFLRTTLDISLLTPGEFSVLNEDFIAYLDNLHK